MKLLIQFSFVFISCISSTAQLYAEQNKKTKNNLKIISIYQIEDESSPGFDFFTSQKIHKCGGKLSNRYRSYSDHNVVNERKFQLVLAALNHQYKVSIKSHGCEGSAMLVDYIGISQ